MNILGKSVVQILDSLKKKEFTYDELYNYFTNRIATYDKDLNSYVTILADTKDHEVKMGGLLSGIPLAIKDNFCTTGIRTTASSRVLDNFVPPYDATVIERLRNSGALINGKTNMDAWAHGSSTETSDYGATKNPYDITRVPGGSSGGSAAAVAAYLAPAAIGSETAGSIRLPAAWCGVVGLKPTYGRVSRYGVIAMGSSWDCPGPITQTVEDAALILQSIAGHDARDATSSTQEVPDYRSCLLEKKKYTIGITDEYFDGVNEEVMEKVNIAMETLKKMGHTFKKVKLIHPKYSISVYTIIQRAEVSSNLGRFDGIRYGNNRTFFGEEAKRRIMLGTYTLSHGYYDAYYKKATKVRRLLQDDFDTVFKEVDFILAPTTPITALPLGDWQKYSFFGEVMDILNEPASAAGIPAINLPIGLDSSGLPIGMQLMAKHFNEENLLNISHHFEKETDFFGVREKALERYKD